MSDTAQQIAERLATIAESVSSVTLDTEGWEPYGSPQGLYLHRLKEAFAADAGLREAVEGLEEISIGQGAFSRDQLTHAQNCIAEMKQAAVVALAKLKGEKA